MASGRFIAYYRVSTDKQGQSGLGLEAQRAAVMAYLNGGNWMLLEEFTEVESGKRADNRPQLAEAMHQARLTGATLVIAKLGRLSRDAAFLLSLRDAGVDFVAADMPNANRLTVGIMALVAEQEREMISARTKAALAAAKARGVKLGGDRGGRAPVDAAAKAAEARRKAADEFASNVAPMMREMREIGASLHQIAATMASKGIRTPRGGAWTATAVKNVLARLP
jgi:DNA invertase Pin-like site-specific DNA recombinase